MRQAPPNQRDQAGYRPYSNVTNLKHAHNLTQTEVDFKIEVMLNFLENISTTSLCVFTRCSSCIMHAQITHARQHFDTSLRQYRIFMHIAIYILYVPWAIQDLPAFIVLPKGRIDYIRPLGHI